MVRGVFFPSRGSGGTLLATGVRARPSKGLSRAGPGILRRVWGNHQFALIASRHLIGSQGECCGLAMPSEAGIFVPIAV